MIRISCFLLESEVLLFEADFLSASFYTGEGTEYDCHIATAPWQN